MDKSDDGSAAVAGTHYTYLLKVTNHGPSDSTGAIVWDTLPAGWRLSPSYNPTCSGDANDPQAVTCLLVRCAGSTDTIAITADVPPGAWPATVTNVARVKANEPDPDSSNDEDREPTDVVRQTDLAMDKSDNGTDAVAGTNYTYTLEVANLGPSDSTGATATDLLPAGWKLVASSNPICGGDANDPQTVTCAVGPLLSAKDSWTITVAVPSGAVLETVLNRAEVRAKEDDPNDGNNRDSEPTSVRREVDLRLTKTESVDPVIAGSGPGNLTYAVTVTNLGPSDASGVEISEVLTLPAGVTVVSITPPLGPGGTWLVGDLPAKAAATLKVVLTVGAATAAGLDVIGDTAAVRRVNEPLIDTGDDTITERTSVRREVDLRLAKTESVDPVIAGSGPGNLTYVVTVTNLGPSDASGVEISEVLTLPAGVTVAPITPPLGPGGIWAVGDLPVKAAATLKVVLTVSAATATGVDVIGDTATVTHVNERPIDTGDDAITERTSVRREVDLRLTKTESVDPVIAGSGPGNLTYVVTVTNLGPSDASGVEIGEVLTLPAGVSVASITPPLGPGGTWAVGDLPVKAAATLKVVLTVGAATAAGVDVIGDTATVTHVNEPLIDTDDDTITERTSVSRETDLAMDKSDDGSVAVPGSNYTYTLEVKNLGPSDSTGATVTERLAGRLDVCRVVQPDLRRRRERSADRGLHGWFAGRRLNRHVHDHGCGAARRRLRNGDQLRRGRGERNRSGRQERSGLRNDRRRWTNPIGHPVHHAAERLSAGLAAPGRDAGTRGLAAWKYLRICVVRCEPETRVWEDSEPPQSGWTVYEDQNGNNQFDVGETSATTREDGRYVLSNLLQGPYVIRQVLRPGWLLVSPANPDERPVQVEGYKSIRDVNFGNYQDWQIHGYKWSDLNQDGNWNLGEPGMGGWTMSLETDLEPDDFPAGTELNDAYAQLTLTAVGSDGNPIAEPAVVSRKAWIPKPERSIPATACSDTRQAHCGAATGSG